MRRPCAGVLILTCWTAVLLLLLLVAGNKLGGVQGVRGEDLGLQVGGGALRWGGRGGGRRGRGRGLVAPGKRRSAQARLLGLQQPALGLLVQSAPLGLQAAVIPLFLSPLRRTDKSTASDEVLRAPQPTHWALQSGEGDLPSVPWPVPRPR